MEFEQYLERDIITFLDSKMEKKEGIAKDREEDYGLYLTRDYLKELNYALDNDEITRAKKLFDELKQHHSRLPKSSIERRKIYSLLEKMYDKIQNYVKIKEGKIEIIKQGGSEIFKDRTEQLPNINVEEEKTRAEMTSSDRKEILSEMNSVKKNSMLIRSDTISGPNRREKAEDYRKKKIERDHSVESNITGSTLKDNEKKYYEDESKEEIKEDMSEQDIFGKGKHQKTKSKNEYERQEKEYNLSRQDRIDDRVDRVKQHAKLHELKDETIEKTSSRLDDIKAHISERLLDELYKKLEEEKDMQNKKIEALRTEIINRMVEELDKRFTDQKYEESKKIEHVRSEILDQVYRQAQHAVTSSDNQDNISVEHYHIESPTMDLPSVERSDVIRFVRDESMQTFEKAVEEEQISENKYSGDELRIVYEQAVYYMFDNKYTEAAKLFRKIIAVQPSNKAARIRLQECIEKQPEISESKDVIEDSTMKELVSKNPDTKNSDEKDIKEIFDQSSEDNLDETESTASGTKINESNRVTHKYKDDEMQKLYEQAIYTMFQNNYSDALKMFQQILRIRPDNKAARIRLQECMEAMGDA